MPIAGPTAPVPPTPPTVPGARENIETPASADAAAGSQGHEFGVHITVTNPQDKEAVRVARDTEPQPDNTAGAQTKENAAAPSAAPQADTQAVQSAVPPAAGKAEEIQQQTAEADAPWPVPGNTMQGMSYLPLVLVFVAAFITFTIRNLSRNRKRIAGSAKPPIKSEKAAAKMAADKNKGKHFEMRI